MARRRCSDKEVADEKSSDLLLANLSSSSKATPALLTRRWRADSLEDSSCVSFWHPALSEISLRHANMSEVSTKKNHRIKASKAEAAWQSTAMQIIYRLTLGD